MEDLELEDERQRLIDNSLITRNLTNLPISNGRNSRCFKGALEMGWDCPIASKHWEDIVTRLFWDAISTLLNPSPTRLLRSPASFLLTTLLRVFFVEHFEHGIVAIDIDVYECKE